MESFYSKRTHSEATHGKAKQTYPNTAHMVSTHIYNIGSLLLNCRQYVSRRMCGGGTARVGREDSQGPSETFFQFADMAGCTSACSRIGTAVVTLYKGACGPSHQEYERQGCARGKGIRPRGSMVGVCVSDDRGAAVSRTIEEMSGRVSAVL